VGLFSYFRDRRERESQLQQLREAGLGIESTEQVFDLRGTDARKEILAVLQQHGVDTAAGGAPGDPVAIQADILAALSRAGLDLSGMGVASPAAASLPSEPPEELDPEQLRRDPDSGIRNPLRSGAAPPSADLGEVAGLIKAALAQGNVTVSADGKVIDLSGTALHGQGFEPIELPGEERNRHDSDR
jgi:hypothetical protein